MEWGWGGTDGGLAGGAWGVKIVGAQCDILHGLALRRQRGLWYSGAMELSTASSFTTPAGPLAAVKVQAMQHDKLLAYSHGLRFAEFVRRSERFGRLLQTRLAETRLGPAVQLAAACFPETMNILAVVSEEDPDTLAVLPIIARLVAAGPRLMLRVLSDDDDLTPLFVLAPELDPATLLNEWDLPQFLCFDEDWFLQAQWGPRPNAAEADVEAWLASHPEYETLADDESPAGQEQYAALVEELLYEMRVWYNSGLTQSCLEEWLELLRAWQAADELAATEGNPNA